ncbi:MAG: plastocyanin [Micropepsaceae bacterium]
MMPEHDTGHARALRATLISVAAAAASLALTAIALAGTSRDVQQRGRMFDPGEVSVVKGDTLRIVNNDADLLHHAYVESSSFNFDSGEQQPGTSVDIKFTQPGQFEVLCGIHPKMRLAVTVK